MWRITCWEPGLCLVDGPGPSFCRIRPLLDISPIPMGFPLFSPQTYSPLKLVSERASIRVGEDSKDHPVPLQMEKPSTDRNRGSFTSLLWCGSIISIEFRSRFIRVYGRLDNVNLFITHICPLSCDFAVFLTIVCSILGAWPYDFHWPMECWWAWYEKRLYVCLHGLDWPLVLLQSTTGKIMPWVASGSRMKTHVAYLNSTHSQESSAAEARDSSWMFTFLQGLQATSLLRLFVM